MTSKEALKYLLVNSEELYSQYEEDEKFYLDVPAIRISSILPETKKEYFPLWTSSKWEKIEKMI